MSEGHFKSTPGLSMLTAFCHVEFWMQREGNAIGLRVLGQAPTP